MLPRAFDRAEELGKPSEEAMFETGDTQKPADYVSFYRYE
jgi:hypothetical protein